MALTILDAGVVIGHLDPADPHHAAAAASLAEHAGDDLRLPASAYAEALVGAYASGRADEVRNKIAALEIRVEPVDAGVAEQVAELRWQHRSLRLPDALVLATAEAVDADTVLTTDRRWRRFARVRIVG
jgi:predicted nucleic acid-binding protein